MNYALLSVVAFTCIFPMLHLLAVSFSDVAAVSANKVVFAPVNFTIDSYEEIFYNSKFLQAAVVSVKRVTVGVVINLIMIVVTAYPLSFETNKFKGRTLLMWFFVLPMLFSGGLIPTYLLIRSLGLLDKFLVLILPGALPIFSMIIMMNLGNSRW